MKRKLILLCFIALQCTIIYAQTDWHINGNGGTTDSNFIGTTDAKALVFKINNQKAGLLEFTLGNAGFGYQSLNSNTVAGNANSAFGYKSLYSNTTGYRNTAVGSSALEFNTSGALNTAAGMYALYHNTTANFNTAVGGQVLFYNTTGTSNTSIGVNSLFNDTSGSWNAASGVNALYNNKSGNNNSAFGANAMLYSTTGNNNTAVGWYALDKNTTGSYNTAVGDSALFVNTTGNYNTAVGKLAGPTKPTFTNTTALGFKASPAASNQVRIGNANVTSIGGQVGWTIFSDERVKNSIQENVPGLSFIKALRPVTYHYNIAKENELLGVQNQDAKEAGSDIEKISFTGLIAQEVDKAAKKIGYDFSGIDKSGPIMGLRYSDFIVPVIKSLQELSEENEMLKKDNAYMQQQIDELKILVQSVAENSSATVSAAKGSTSEMYLEQNAPNPFTSNTTIRYKVPATGSATIMIANTAGSTVKTFTLTTKGNGSVIVNANELAAGTYYYSLIVDGKKTDSKKMILVK